MLRDKRDTYRYDVDNLPEGVEEAVEEVLGFLRGDEFHDALVGFVRSKVEE